MIAAFGTFLTTLNASPKLYSKTVFNWSLTIEVKYNFTKFADAFAAFFDNSKCLALRIFKRAFNWSLSVELKQCFTKFADAEFFNHQWT